MTPEQKAMHVHPMVQLEKEHMAVKNEDTLHSLLEIAIGIIREHGLSNELDAAFLERLDIER